MRIRTAVMMIIVMMMMMIIIYDKVKKNVSEKGLVGMEDGSGYL